MKKVALILIILLFYLGGYAQIQDLAKLVNHKRLVESFTVKNQNNTLFGYVFVLQGDLIEKKTYEYEILVLDKNLNQLVKQNFTKKVKGNIIRAFTDCHKTGKQLLFTIDYTHVKSVAIGLNTPYKHMFSTYMTLDLENSKISEEFYYADHTFKNLNIPVEELKNNFKNNKSHNRIYCIDNKAFSGYLVTKNYNNLKDNYKATSVNIFNKNKRFLWAFDFNKDASWESFNKITSINWPDDMAIIEQVHYNKNKKIKVDLIALNIATGKQLFKYNLEHPDYDYSHNYIIKKYGDKIYLAGTYYKNTNTFNFNFDNKLGLFKITLDTSGNELNKTYIPWSDANKYLKLDKKGKLGNGYYLSTREVFIFNDGSFSYLAEKYKPQKNILITTLSSKTTDMVLFNFDKNTTLLNVNVLEKSKNYGFHYDYLFSQYLEQNNKIVFFYRDYKAEKSESGHKDKKWVLGINSIKNGKLSEEQIPISSKDNQIIPTMAKEGYILLREYNKNRSYDQLRIEKLNL